ncbi:MAG: hypothetical protein JWM73_43, partial [Solirubrobacterales bacterium]|nr:hypothetical protein [Solirubrobacterales bacterium]
ATFNKLGKAVEGLTAAPQQTDTVALSWQDQLTTSPGGGGVKYYEVDVRDAADQPTTSVPVKTDALGYTPIASTIADGQYTWRVRAIDASGTALAWSAPGSFEKRSSVPQPLAPDAFQTLPTLRWNATSFAASYDVEVFRGVDPDFPAGSKVAAASATTLPYPVMTPSAALTAGSYSWRVRQHDATGKVGPWSTDVLPFTVGGDQPVISAPADTAGVPVPSLVYRWSAVPGAVRYRVESSTSSGFGTLTDSVVTSSTAYAPTVAHVGGTTYYWRVSALNAADATMRTSDPASFTAQTAPAAPAASAAVAGRSIGVSWTTPGTGGAPISGYVLRFRPAGTTDWTEQSLAGDVGAAGLGEVPAGQKYEAQVAAVNAVGTGPFSTLVTSTAPTVPGTPAALKLTARAGGLSVTWSKPADGGSAITGYAVRVQPATGGSVTETSAAASPAVIDGLAQGVAYTVEVAAENIVGRGAFVAGQGTTGTVPSTASAITLTGPAAVGYGRAAALAGALTSKAGAPIAGAAVVLESRRSSTAPWVAVTPVTTGANGAFTAAVRPIANTQYQARFAGAPPNLGVTSTALSVMVAPKIALRARTLSARKGRTVRLAGSVLPKTAGRTVTLSCLEQQRWVARGTGRTSSTGSFRVPLKLTTRGRKTCRIDTTADAVAGAGQSARVLIRAR